MSDWFSALLGKVLREETRDFVIRGPLTVDGTAPAFDPLVGGATYLLVSVKSLRLPYRRKNVTRYSGVVHAFANLPGLFGAAKFASATTPDGLASLDAKNKANVLTLNKPIVGPTPWAVDGGDLQLQIGLFSVADENLATPFLKTMTTLSDTIGVAFAASVKPFVDVITTGVQAFTSSEGKVALEIGLDVNYRPPQPGYYALVAAEKGKLKTARFDLDSADMKLRVDGKNYEDEAYLVFGVEAVKQQPRWAEIAELQRAYALVQAALRNNDLKAATEAVEAFRLLALTSPDLIASDAKALVKKAEDWVKDVLGGANTSLTAGTRQIPDFKDLDLYG